MNFTDTIKYTELDDKGTIRRVMGMCKAKDLRRN